VAITEQEAWTNRGDGLTIPRFVREIVEGVAFAARRDKKVDSRSGVSQRLSITALEDAVSSAERRALLRGEPVVVPRVADVDAALPAITGKLELEYEGELAGAERVARGLIRKAVGEAFSVYLGARDLGTVVAHFEGGASLRLSGDTASDEALRQLARVPGLLEAARDLAGGSDDSAALVVSAAEFVLEGLCAQKKIGRSPDRGFVALERPTEAGIDLAQLERLRAAKRRVN
jgi:magnesium chelatase subunit I